MTPQRANQRTGPPGFEQHGHYGELPPTIPMDQMRDHVVPLAVDLLLRWLVEVKLHELVSSTTDRDEAPGCIVDLDGVAVIHDPERDRLVSETDWREVCLVRDAVLEIDGRLCFPDRAATEVVLERAPFLGAGCSRVAPVRTTLGSQ